MTTPANRLVIFDCDGTLSDGQHMITKSMHMCFDRAGIPRASDDAVRGIIGLSLREAMEHLLPDMETKDHLALSESYKTSFFDLRESGAFEMEPLYPGTEKALMALEQAGYLLAVATGKSLRGLERVLGQHGLRDMFISLQTADHHPSKPHPSMIQTAIMDAGSRPEDAVMIGDTTYDIIMAKNAGVQSIGVDWGYHNAQELTANGAVTIASDYSDLPSMVDALLSEKETVHV